MLCVQFRDYLAIDLCCNQGAGLLLLQAAGWGCLFEKSRKLQPFGLFQEVESHTQDWEEFLSQVKRTRKPYLDLIGGGDKSKVSQYTSRRSKVILLGHYRRNYETWCVKVYPTSIDSSCGPGQSHQSHMVVT